MRDLQGSKEAAPTHDRGAEATPDPTLMSRLPEQAEIPVIEDVPLVAGPPMQAPSAGTPEKARKAQGRIQSPKPQPLTPEIQPINARRARFADSEDDEMPEVRNKEKASKGAEQKGSGRSEASPASIDKGVPRPDGTVVPKSPGRQSELTGTVDQKGVLNRILDMQVPMSLREIMVTSKEIRTEIKT
jgi:hypothetical protein